MDEEDEKKMCIKNNIQDNTKFVGNVNTVRDFLAVSDVYLMTSKIEGLGNATVEAMGAAIPCVLYDTPGSRDLGIDGAPGILIEPNSISLEKEIFNLYSKENIYKTDLGKKSLDYVLKHYSKSIAIKKWRNLYTN